MLGVRLFESQIPHGIYGTPSERQSSPPRQQRTSPSASEIEF